MKQYERFIFDSVEFDEGSGQIRLHYSLDNEISFTETLTLPEELALVATDSPALERALFALHLIGGISYFKTCLPQTIEVRSGLLTKEQAAFWNTVYEQGLGEFFFKNDIDPTNTIHFPVTGGDASPIEAGKKGKTKVLVPIGGGKDSLVTMELLKEAHISTTLLRIGDHHLIRGMAFTANLPLLNIKRALSPELFKLNEEGALNGHVPITAYLSFLSVVIAIVTGHTDVVLSNESSANEGNIEWKGRSINHQWSKSMAFERMLQEYLAQFVTKDVSCFSLLRRWSELSIVEKFVEYPQYLPLFTSCNRNWHLLAKKEMPSKWCGECPKFAFAFLLLAAFLPKDEVVGVFGKNLFEDAKLLPLYRELLGLTGQKPFECVGTPTEVQAAFLMAKNRGEFDGTPVMKMFLDESEPSVTNEDETIGEAMLPSDDHAIPADFLPLVS